MLFFKEYFDLFFAITILSSVVFFHELGHYLFARLFNVYVHSFSIGIGFPIVSFKDRFGTFWQVGILPIGGYLNLESITFDSKDEKEINDHRQSLESLSLFKKLLISFAGPLFNFLIFYFLMFFVFFNSYIHISTDELSNIHYSSSLKILNDSDLKFIVNQPYNFNKISSFKLSIKDAFILTFRKSREIFSKLSFKMGGLSGPIGVISSIKGSIQKDFFNLLIDVSLLSLFIGIWNLLPIPCFDGGDMLLLLMISFFEYIFNFEVSERFYTILNYLSIALLFIIFFYLSYLDLSKIFFKGVLK